MSKKNEPKQEEMFPAQIEADNLQQRALAMRAESAVMAENMKELGVESADLEIPKLMLMQGTSEAVGAGSAKLGDVINTMSNEVVGGFDSAVELVPLKMYKTLRTYDITNPSERKFMRAEPINAQNVNLPYEGNENGVPVKRYVNLNFFVLLKKEVEAEEAFPCVISFKSSSMPAGKQLATQLFKMVAINKRPYSQTVKIGVRKEKKGTNVYAVFEVKKGEKATEIVAKTAEDWLIKLASLNYKVREDEREEEESAPVQAPTVISASSAQGPY